MTNHYGINEPVLLKDVELVVEPVVLEDVEVTELACFKYTSTIII